jgi:hypothetical protein
MERVSAAKGIVAEIWQNQRFWDLVQARTLLPSPTEPPMSGADVVKYLRKVRPDLNQYSLHRFGFLGVLPPGHGGYRPLRSGCRSCPFGNSA